MLRLLIAMDCSTLVSANRKRIYSAAQQCPGVSYEGAVLHFTCQCFQRVSESSPARGNGDFHMVYLVDEDGETPRNGCSQPSRNRSRSDAALNLLRSHHRRHWDTD